jgi:hypothetical protein
MPTFAPSNKTKARLMVLYDLLGKQSARKAVRGHQLEITKPALRLRMYVGRRTNNYIKYEKFYQSQRDPPR